MSVETLDLGHGHMLSWLVAEAGSSERIGAVIDHPAPGKTESGFCSGVVRWAPSVFAREHPDQMTERERSHPFWELHGTADEFLTLTPSVLCPTCGDHGYVTKGRWIPA